MKNKIEEIAKQFEYTNGIYGFKQGVKYQQKEFYFDMQQYAEFCIKCDRENLPLLVVKDWYEQFKN
jgi:ADP-dependent phosphofructokinase/glucokinase